MDEKILNQDELEDVRVLARESGLDEKTVIGIYWDTKEKFFKGAKIKDYISLLVKNQVREVLNKSVKQVPIF